jgi:hypothetical protein
MIFNSLPSLLNKCRELEPRMHDASADFENDINIRTYANLYYDDRKLWQELHNYPLYVLNKTTNIAYLMLCSSSEHEFLKRHLDDDDYVVTPQVLDDTVVWTLLTHPLIRFCKVYKFNSHWLGTRISGHPSGYFQLGTSIIDQVIDFNTWPWINQADIIGQARVDCIIYSDLLTRRFPTHDIENKLLNEVNLFAEAINKWNEVYDKIGVWPPGDPFHCVLKNHPYLEESVHEFIVQNPAMLDKFQKNYQKDYTLIDDHDRNENLVHKTSYDQYWAWLEHGENYVLYS